MSQITNEYKVSVIVPVFNVEEYLVECLDSILTQSFEDFEIIIVDNGSTDNSFFIAEKYVENNSNIRLYHHPHGKLGGARNFGIKKSKAEFLMFVDSDDFLPEDALECLFRCTQEDDDLDVIVGNIVKYKRNGIEYFKEFEYIHKREQLLYGINDFHYLIKSQTATNKLFRRSLLEKHNLLFPENLIHEDLYFTTIALIVSRKIKIIPNIVYYYRKFEQPSITSGDSEVIYFENRLEVLEKLDNYLLENDLLEYKEIIDFYKLNKFYAPILQKMLNHYDDETSRTFFYRMNKHFQTIDIDLIRQSKTRIPVYIFIKYGLFNDFEFYRKNNCINSIVDNGRLYINSVDKSISNKNLDITSQIRNIKLKYRIEDIKIENGIYQISGYCFFPGVKIEKNNTFIKNIYLKNFKDKEEVYSFDVVEIERKDICFVENGPVNSGFTAKLDLKKIEKIENKNFHIYINLFYYGLVKEEKISIDDSDVSRLMQKTDYNLAWRLTNIKENYLDNLKEKNKKFYMRSITGCDYIKIILKRDMIKMSDNHVIINFENYPRLENETIKIENSWNKVVFEGKIIENKVKVKVTNNLFLLKNYKIKMADYIIVDTEKLFNLISLKKRRRYLSKFVLGKNITSFGVYLMYLKLSKRRIK